jgi:regulatory protein
VISGRKRRGPRESIADKRARYGAIDDPEVVLAAALRFLEARPRSASEVRRRLTGAGYREELVAAAIVRLTELGVLDDEAFARAWVESRDRVRPRGERALRSELAQKGIERQLSDDVLEQRAIEQPDADAAAARRVLERHASALARVADPRTRRQRAYALLARSGFDSETAVEAIATMLPRDSEG